MGIHFTCVGNLMSSKWKACLMEVTMKSISAKVDKTQCNDVRFHLRWIKRLGLFLPFLIRMHFASTWDCKSSNNPYTHKKSQSKLRRDTLVKKNMKVIPSMISGLYSTSVVDTGISSLNVVTLFGMLGFVPTPLLNGYFWENLREIQFQFFLVCGAKRHKKKKIDFAHFLE